jgi:hypothetical protein
LNRQVAKCAKEDIETPSRVGTAHRMFEHVVMVGSAHPTAPFSLRTVSLNDFVDVAGSTHDEAYVAIQNIT